MKTEKALRALTILTWLLIIGFCVLFASNVELDAAWRLIAVAVCCLVAGAAFNEISLAKHYKLRDFLKASISLFSTVGLMLGFALVKADQSNVFFGATFLVFGIFLGLILVLCSLDR